MLFKKLFSIIHYLGASILMLLAFLGGTFLYPFIYPFRKHIRNTPIFWWWFDDEDGYYGAEYWKKAKKITKNNFWISYRWCGLRNPMWNAHTKIVPKSGTEKVISAKGKLTQDGKEIALHNNAVLIYVDENGKYTGNAGDFFSEKYSILGWSFVWFTIPGRLYWKFSLAKSIIWNIGINIQIGVFHRYIFKFKINKLKPLKNEKAII